MNKESLANSITFGGWFIAIMFFVITNAFGVMFEASMLILFLILVVEAIFVLYMLSLFFIYITKKVLNLK